MIILEKMPDMCMGESGISPLSAMNSYEILGIDPSLFP